MEKVSKEEKQGGRDILSEVFPLIDCAVCGKRFLKPHGDWAYKQFRKGKMHYFCSYPCMRVMQKEMEAEEAAKRNKKPPKVDLRKKGTE